ncbi:MAG: hypothetical protein D3910_24425, partial [Candidatus Electrothrix sp. ATG2]|nr:hypothetical protein [Candidatus Electrothrix sp. ATG2]
MKTRILFFVFGMLAGMLLLPVAGMLFALQVPALLIVDEPARQADIAVVLGGGGGSRFRKGLSLHEADLVDYLLLVDKQKNAWDWMLQKFCPNCLAEEKVIIIEGSKNTFTDAELVEEYCQQHGTKNILVVTDPYH